MSHATVRLCKDTYAGIRNFIQLGLHPGSFGEALILRDRARAYDRAHATLREENVVDEMLEWVGTIIPATLFTSRDDISRWCSHGGLRGAPPNDQMHLYLMSNWWKPKAVEATA